VWISGSPFSRTHATYDVIFEGPVNGLTEGGEVRFNGIKVGEVKQLSLDRKDPNRVIARIQVEAETPVRADSYAQLNLQGITGVNFIQIFAGSPDKPLVTHKLGDPVPVIPTKRTALDELFQGGQDVFTQAGDAIKSLNKALTEENVQSVTNILHNLDEASAKLAKKGGVIDSAQAVMDNANATLGTIDAAAKSVDVAVKDVDRQVNQIGGQANQILADAGPVVKDAGAAIGSLKSTLARVDQQIAPSAATTLSQFSAAAGDLRTLMVRLQGLAGEIEQDPSRFVYRKPEPTER
jgi:phospholipid/cholesterol/gamma-HCH transport system substrate-binding protein